MWLSTSNATSSESAAPNSIAARVKLILLNFFFYFVKEKHFETALLSIGCFENPCW
jgi:hypothetical protein